MSVNTEMTANAAALIVDHHISQNYGDHNALRFREKRYSYHDLAALMNRAGNMLRRFGVNAGDTITVAVSPSPSLLATIFGAMKIGAASILLSRDLSDVQIRALLDKHKPKLLIVEEARAAALASVAGGLTVLVVGEAGAEQRSFLQEMRESPSSLSRSPISNGAPAFAVASNDNVTFIAHDQIVKAQGGSPIPVELDQWDIGRAFGRFARGEEEVIA